MPQTVFCTASAKFVPAMFRPWAVVLISAVYHGKPSPTVSIP